MKKTKQTEYKKLLSIKIKKQLTY